MNQFIKKAFSLHDLKYRWLLILSIIIFAASLYIEHYYDPIKCYIGFGYLTAFAVEVLWGIFNYIDHIRINTLYKKHFDIEAYVSSLAMSQEEVTELKAYLNDYVSDLESQGKSRREAMRIAIEQFKVREFSWLSKNTSLFDLHAHYYLLGFTAIMITSFLLLAIIGSAIFGENFIMHTLRITLIVYGAGFLALFILYKMIDALIYRKFRP